jgi:integrase/recombinase XerD
MPVIAGSMLVLQKRAATAFGLDPDAYMERLVQRGYAGHTINLYVSGIAHFADWLSRHHFEPSAIREGLITRFLDHHLPRCQCAPWFSRSRSSVRAALKHLLAILRAQGDCSLKISPVSPAIERELIDFDRRLSEVRGLSVLTRSSYLRRLKDFLTDRFGNGIIKPHKISPRDVADFVERYTSGHAPCTVNAVGIALRHYFAHCASRGTKTKVLSAALPRVAQWRLASLPKTLTPMEIHRLLNAFDRTTATGKRDYAIARCFVDLGLRRTEVAHLQLDDLDWAAGALRIHGKSKRVDILPLPDATGRAIVDYLRAGRPHTTRREVFVRHRPPVNAPADIDIVRNAVRNAARRCGLQDRIRGTHIFRHTVAGRLVQSGTPFKQIADLLRHRSLDTTTIYAKIDLDGLAQVSLPWPGRQS